ncbi:MAG: peptide chain release factor 2 [Leptospiraceae bacterium]|nr:peptide chain release factor 2 [Leptospiraceae bacterium]
MQSLKELVPRFQEFNEQFERRFNELRLPDTEKELAELQIRLEDPSIWSDEKKKTFIRETQTRIAALDRRLQSWRNLRKGIEDAREYLDIAMMENAQDMAAELETKLDEMTEIYDQLDLESLLNGPDDFRNAFLNIHPGAGGTESQDWADMLYRAYSRWCEKSQFNVAVVDYQEGEEAGIKNVTLHVKGTNAYGFLKAENGIHRLVRISPFDANKKRHTSFAAVHVSPEISDDVEIDINEKDLRVDTFRSSGAGGQHVNKTESAIRITHHPTGIVVACQTERSQIQNRETAMSMLRARLYELAQEEKQKEIESKSGERKDISWGNQIRSYVFHPYNMVKDLRTGQQTSDVQGVMNGNFDPFIDAFLRGKRSEVDDLD